VSVPAVRSPTLAPASSVLSTSALKAGSARSSTPSALCTIVPVLPCAAARPMRPGVLWRFKIPEPLLVVAAGAIGFVLWTIVH
jgi:hypothetical protein